MFPSSSGSRERADILDHCAVSDLWKGLGYPENCSKVNFTDVFEVEPSQARERDEVSLNASADSYSVNKGGWPVKMFIIYQQLDRLSGCVFSMEQRTSPLKKL